MAQYLRAGGTDAKVAVSLYGLLSTLNGFAWLGSWVHLARYPQLLCAPYDAAYARLERRRSALGVATYAVATVIAWVLPTVALLLFLATAIFYAVTSSGSRLPALSEVDA